jgi:hypothetical protein
VGAYLTKTFSQHHKKISYLQGKYSPLFSFYASKFRYNCSVIRRFVAVPLTWYFGAGKRTTPIV